MSLLAVRKLFVKWTGRYDLVTSANTFDDNPSGYGGGANTFIQEGQRFLEREINFMGEEAELSVAIATGAITSSLSGFRAVREVAVLDSTDETMVLLPRKSLAALRDSYGDENGSLSGVSRGEPNVWATGFLRTSVNSATYQSGLQLVFMPPADRNYTLKVRGLVKSSALTNDASESFWTEEHPHLLVWAAMYMLETSYRNFQGAQAIRRSIQDYMEGIENDLTEQSLVGDTQMGSVFRYIEDIGYRSQI